MFKKIAFALFALVTSPAALCVYALAGAGLTYASVSERVDAIKVPPPPAMTRAVLTDADLGVEVTLTQRPCASPVVLILIDALQDVRGEYLAADIEMRGIGHRAACWARKGRHVLVVEQSGAMGLQLLTDFTVKP